MPDTPTPDAVIERWQQAFVDQDVDALVDLYEAEAIFAVPAFDANARGSDEIRKVYEGFRELGKTDTVEIESRDSTTSGDYAFAHMKGALHCHAPDGSPMDIPFVATEVMHRGADGNWRYVIDHA